MSGLYGTVFVQDDVPHYDGRVLSWFEIVLGSLVRDRHIIIPMFFFWFVLQYGSQFVLSKILRSFRALSLEERQQFSIRLCATVNGLLCLPGAILFVIAPKDGKHYHIIRGPYEFTRASIITYFAWDVFVCHRYNWDWAWKVHAWCSVAGTVLLNFPISDGYQCSFSGLFEMSNAFIHIAEMLRVLDTTRPEEKRIHTRAVTLLQYLFAFLFLVIRVIVGTWITYLWGSEMVELMVSGRCHSNFAIASCLVMLGPMMFLQYFWFYKIVRVGAGLDAADGTPVDSAEVQTPDKKGQ